MSTRGILVRVSVTLGLVIFTHLLTLNIVNSILFAQKPSSKQNPNSKKMAKVADEGANKTATLPGINAAGIEMIRISASDAAKAHAIANAERPFNSPSGSESRLIESSTINKDHGIQFHAKVYVADSSLDVSYMWSIRIYNIDMPDWNYVRHYDAQVFSMPESHQITVTFDESIPFDPGKYRAVLSLYKMKSGIDMTKVDDNLYADPFLAIRVINKVTVD